MRGQRLQHQDHRLMLGTSSPHQEIVPQYTQFLSSAQISSNPAARVSNDWTRKTSGISEIDIPTLFPSLLKKHKLQALWTEFYRLVQELGKIECNADKFELTAKAWIRSFLAIYQTTDVTPCMHAFAMHVAEFLHLYGSIVMFTQ